MGRTFLKTYIPIYLIGISPGSRPEGPARHTVWENLRKFGFLKAKTQLRLCNQLIRSVGNDWRKTGLQYSVDMPLFDDCMYSDQSKIS